MKSEQVLLGIVAAALAYEVFTLADKCEGNTISEIIWTTTAKRPILPFALGVLCGHFFWQRVVSTPTPPTT